MTVFRPEFPNVYMGCRTNAAVLNHWLVVGFASDTLWPVASGRSLPIFVLARFTPSVGLTGKPERQVTIDPSCHPPATASRNLFSSPTLRPFPKGRSYSPETTRRCALLNAESPRSHRWQYPDCQNSVSLSEVRIPLVSSIDSDHG